MRPFEVEPSSWPARPTRCRPRATDFGLSTGNPAGLQVLLDHEPLLARERAVMRAGDLVLGELVQAHRQPLRETPVVHEHDCRPVRTHELEQRRVDGGPDRARGRLVAGGHLDPVGHDRLRELGRRAELAEVLHRHDDLEVEVLPRPRVDEPDRAVAADEAADLLERTLGRREPDPLGGVLEQSVEPLERDRQVGAALRPGDRMHLVDDHGLDRPQRLARLRGQHQEERLRRRDQDVGRLLQELAALLLRGVAGADADAQLRLQARKRPPQVALDVVVQRLQRRDVQEAEAGAGSRVEPIDPVEERGQRLAGAGGSLDQDVPAGGDRGPTNGLRGRRPGEGTLEPGPRLV
jgi:hypothetical protein